MLKWLQASDMARLWATILRLWLLRQLPLRIRTDERNAFVIGCQEQVQGLLNFQDFQIFSIWRLDFQDLQHHHIPSDFH